MSGATKSVAQRVVEIARSQLGVAEATGRNDGLPAELYSSGRQEAWCANFVAWVYRQAGQPLVGNRHKLRSVAYMMAEQQRVGTFWAACGQEGSDLWPQAGDLVFFDWRLDSDQGGGRHVEILERIEKDPRKPGGLILHTIGGNVGNAVARRGRNIQQVVGFARPKGVS